uniref:Putative trypsin-like serine protease n=1 Tax=Culex tarsalis TaxID=7177 RepID=A0A1Q3G3B5_CULTA
MCLKSVALLTFVIFGATLGQNSTTSTSSERNSTRIDLIVGGGDAGPTPYQASLQRHRGHFCGGTIIDSRWILTAAHCLSGLNPNDVTVLVGTTQLSRGGFRFRADQFFLHPNWDRTKARNDIGLIRIKGLMLSMHGKVEKATFGADFVRSGTEAIVTGWGGTRQNGGPLSDKLQFVRVRVLGEEDCQARLANIGPMHICTFSREGQGVCGGDSGGPLAIGSGTVIGVVSFGVGYPPDRGCAAGLPDGFARVSTFNSWIRDTMKSRRFG